MHSNTNITNTVLYNGKVDIKLQRNNKKYTLQVHNSGTKYLTNTIVKALCGNNINDNIPSSLTMVAVKKVNENENNYISLLRYEIPFTGITWGDVVETVENGSVMKLTATILPDDKLPLSSVNQYPIELQMRSATNEILATIRCDGTDDTSLHDLYNSLGEGTSGIIEWSMYFKF